MIKWRPIADRPETKTLYLYAGPGIEYDVIEYDVVPKGGWLFCWADGTMEYIWTDEGLTPAEWPGRMVEKPTHWAEINLPEGVR